MTTVFYVVKEVRHRGINKDNEPTDWLHSRRQAGPFASRPEAEAFQARVVCTNTAMVLESSEVTEGPLYASADECRVLL